MGVDKLSRRNVVIGLGFILPVAVGLFLAVARDKAPVDDEVSSRRADERGSRNDNGIERHGTNPGGKSTGAAPKGTAPARPTILATGLHNPGDIAVDATHVYFAEDEDPNDEHRMESIKRIPLRGGPVATLASRQRNAVGLVVAETTLLWLVSGDSDKGERGALRAMPIGGGEPRDLTRASVYISPPLAIRGVEALWADGNAIWRMPWKGGAKTKVAHAQSTDITSSIASDALNVYWIALNKLMRAPLPNGPAVVMATVGIHVYGIAVDSEHVYFTDKAGERRGGALRRIDKNGGPVETIAVGQELPWGVVADENAVYWVNNADQVGSVMRFKKPSGPVQTLATNPDAPADIVADATHLYWTCAGAGTVASIPKPTL